MNYKKLKLIDLSVEMKQRNREMTIARALYYSAKGTKHFYDALVLLSEAYPDFYKEDLEEYNAKF